MTVLPNGWTIASLGSLVEMNPKHPADLDETSEVSFVPMAAVSDRKGAIEPHERRRYGDVKKGYTHFKSGDVIFAKITPCMENGKSAVARDLTNGVACGSTEFFVLRSRGAILPELLHRFIRQDSFRAAARAAMTGVVGQARVTKNFMESVEVPVPPLAEQRRIADRLEDMLARVDACRDRLDLVPGILKRFRQAVLAAAFRGDLTADWRPERSSKQTELQKVRVGEPYIHLVWAPQGWRQYDFQDICRLEGGSQPPKSTFSSELKDGYIRLIQIRDYKSDKHITYIPKALAKRFCSADDIMIGRYGPPIFQILRGLNGAYNVALMKAVPHDVVDRDFLYYYLQTSDLLSYVEAGSDRTAGQDGVRKELLNRYPVFLPEKDEQREIVRRIELLLSVVSNLLERSDRARDLAAALTPSILAMAFRGDLVHQDPNDEPASVLLDRIRAERKVTPPAKRRKPSPITAAIHR